MTFTPKPWQNYPAQATPRSADALIDQEERLAAYTDAQVAALGVPALDGRLDSVESNSALRANLAANLKDFTGDVVGGNWQPIVQDLYDAGRPIYVPEGTYDLEGDVTLNGWAPQILGAGKGRTIFLQQGDEPLFSQYKDSTGSAYAKRESLTTAVITSDLQPGGSVVKFSTTGYASGDYIVIKSTLLWPVIDEGAVYGEIARILTIDSSTQATLTGPLDEQYLLADSPTVTKLDLLSGLHFSDFTFQNPSPGTGSGFGYGIYANYCRAPRVERVEFIGLDAAAASFKHSVAWRAVDLDFFDLTDDSANNRYGYGVNPGAGSRDGKVLRCHMHGGRHSFTLGATLGEVPVRNTLVALCSATGTSSYCFDTHGPGRFTTFQLCEAHNSRERAYNNRAYDTTYVQCQSDNNGSGFVDSSDALRTHIFGGEVRRAHQVAGAGGNGVNLSGADPIVENLKIADTEGIGLVLNSTAVRGRLKGVECYRTETNGTAGAKRGIAVSANDATVENCYGEGVDKVIRYSNATGILERGTRGKTITLLREIAGTCTFTQFEHEPINGQFETVTSTGSVAITPGTHAKQILLTGAISADRGVTVQKTNAVAGMRFHITRTAAATGAFNRNVDNGTAGVTIKALAVSQWVEVMYNGTDWVVVAFGSL